jgi:hypothetical protein
MPRILLLPMLGLALAGCNAGVERRGGADLTQDSGQCSKFSWGTPEMAQCLDGIAAARAAAVKPVETAQPAEPPQPALAAPAPPAVAPAPAPVARTATARGRTARPVVQTTAPIAEPPAAQPPETETPPKSWWSWPWGSAKSETEN